MKKIKNIAKAFINSLPEGEQFYEKRLEICNGCEFNSKNIPNEKLTITDRIKISTGICDNNNHCTACGCCIERKCSVKEETCGLASIGETPKWGPVTILSEHDERITVENLSEETVNFSLNSGLGKSGFVFDFGKTPDPKISVSFLVSKSDGLDIKNYTVGCSCTVGEMTKIDEDTVKFDIDISTLTFRENEETTRTLQINYNDRNKVNSFTIIFKCFKDGGK
jgi:hypothetical protein